MSRGRHPRRLAGAALVAAAAAALLGASALGAAPASAVGRAVVTPAPITPSAGATTAALPVTVALTGISPSTLTVGTSLTVTGVMTNTGIEPVAVVVPRLLLQRDSLGTREEVDAWLTGADLRTGTALPAPIGLKAITIIAPGASVPFSLTSTASELGLRYNRFGAYGLAVEARAQAQGEPGREQVGLVRTTVQWQPPVPEYRAQQIAFLVPFTGLPTGQGGQGATDAEVAAAVAPGSRLRRLLDGASGPRVSWAVDPALLQRLTQVAAAEPTDGDPTTPPAATGTPTTPATGPATASPQDLARRTAADFLAAMRRAAAGRAVVELPYGDPDLAAVTAPVTADRTGRPDLVVAARLRGAGIVAEVLGVTPVSDVGWPVGGWADDGTLGVLASAGVRDVVLDARARRPTDALPYTTDARADLAGGTTGWLSDPRLSSLVGAASSPDVRRVQRLLAETAAVTTERPSLVRRLLVVAPRDLDPDFRALRALTDAATSVPWLSVVPVTELDRPLPGDDPSTADLPRQVSPVPAPVAASQLGDQHVAAVRRLRSTLAALGEVVGSPSGLTDALQGATLQLLSTSWRGRQQPLRDRRAVVAAEVTGLNDRLQVLRSSVTLLATSGRLQITVVNSLPQDVTGAHLKVTSANPRLLVRDADVEVPDLASGTRTQVEVPVRAIASGVVQLDARLVSPSRRPVGRAVTVTVRAQPTGTWALWVVGGAAALVLVVGLVRALRRPRRRHALTTGEP